MLIEYIYLSFDAIATLTHPPQLTNRFCISYLIIKRSIHEHKQSFIWNYNKPPTKHKKKLLKHIIEFIQMFSSPFIFISFDQKKTHEYIIIAHKQPSNN